MNEILAAAEATRHRSPVGEPQQVNPFMARLANLYSEIWTLISASRFCLFFAVSFFIYQSNPGAWGFAPSSSGGYSSRVGEEAISGLDQLKNRVVFTYGFMEMMFWLWVSRTLGPRAEANWICLQIFVALREERQQATARIVGML